MRVLSIANRDGLFHVCWSYENYVKVLPIKSRCWWNRHRHSVIFSIGGISTNDCLVPHCGLFKFLSLSFWVQIFRGILEPIVTLGVLQNQPQPVTLLFELCQKDGKQVDIKHWRKGEKNIASVYVDGQFVASASSEQKENAKLHAAKVALQKLSYNPGDNISMDIFNVLNGSSEIEGAKQKLHELCGKKRWPKPSYRYTPFRSAR